LKYSRYDINGYHFWMVKLEASRALAPTTNNGVVTSGEDATGHVTDYYGILQNIVEYTFGGAKELSVVFFQCHLFDPINDTRVDNFIMVEGQAQIVLFRQQSFSYTSGTTGVLPKLSSPKLAKLMGCLQSQSRNAHSSI
jgi:hypothetical protein